MSVYSDSSSQLERRPAGTLRADDTGRRVLLRAWVHRRRDLGGLLFLDLRDRSGIAQAVVYPEDAAEVYETLEAVRPEWVVEVEGEVVERESKNPDLATGFVEVRVERAQVLAVSDTPPIQVEGQVDAAEELRLKHRYLELRRPELQENFLLRDKVTLAVRNYLHENGFVDLETPILTRSTPEGARDYLVPSRVHRGQFYALPQSPQIFKQILMVAGFERYYQIARCFRDEDLRAERQPEFTQIDLEMSFVSEQDVQSLTEGLLAAVMPLAGIDVELPLPRMTWRDAMARYGSDKPDLRFGCEIVDLSEILGSSGFRGFQAAVGSGGVIRGFAVPAATAAGPTGASRASRKQVDGWVEVARRYGAAGALTLRHRDGELQFQVKNTLTEHDMRAAADALGLEEDGLALIVAGDPMTTAKALGALRLQLAEDFGLIPEDRHAFLWVTEFPLVEWDEEEGRWFAMNHPFTAPDPRDLDLLDTAPQEVRSRGYDVIMDGVELGGGSIRIHTPDLQQRAFELLGIDAEEARSRFGFLLDALRYGAPPHGGIALGLDRMIMLMAGTPSIRDVILFPKTARATCLMTEAPSPVEAKQLEELGLQVVSRDESPADGSSDEG
ncbi:MAG: aspartate--tRNA ligase [Thermoanaerobaculia bacterium]|nr:aspartate--tRNA ligase [Thermoanaerobaculia bacterium]